MLQATKRGRQLGGEGPPPELFINKFNAFGVHRLLLPCRCHWCEHRSLSPIHPSHASKILCHLELEVKKPSGLVPVLTLVL